MKRHHGNDPYPIRFVQVNHGKGEAFGQKTSCRGVILAEAMRAFLDDRDQPLNLVVKAPAQFHSCSGILLGGRCILRVGLRMEGVRFSPTHDPADFRRGYLAGDALDLSVADFRHASLYRL